MDLEFIPYATGASGKSLRQRNGCKGYNAGGFGIRRQTRPRCGAVSASLNRFLKLKYFALWNNLI